ncbi:unnamed protein product [Closterium sp. NIES-65]|nr:unnamed protein product [Closterium sp. NIES-65]
MADAFSSSSDDGVPLTKLEIAMHLTCFSYTPQSQTNARCPPSHILLINALFPARPPQLRSAPASPVLASGPHVRARPYSTPSHIPLISYCHFSSLPSPPPPPQLCTTPAMSGPLRGLPPPLHCAYSPPHPQRKSHYSPQNDPLLTHTHSSLPTPPPPLSPTTRPDASEHCTCFSYTHLRYGTVAVHCSHPTSVPSLPFPPPPTRPPPYHLLLPLRLLAHEIPPPKPRAHCWRRTCEQLSALLAKAAPSFASPPITLHPPALPPSTPSSSVPPPPIPPPAPPLANTNLWLTDFALLQHPPHLLPLHLLMPHRLPPLQLGRTAHPPEVAGEGWTHLGEAGPIWARLDPSGRGWTHLGEAGPFWARLDPSGRGWTARCPLRLDAQKEEVRFHVCAMSAANPYQVDTCLDDGAGGCNCLCPPGFVTGKQPDETPICVPGRPAVWEAAWVRVRVIKACVRAWVIKACVRAWVIKACVRAWVIKACVRAWVIKACVRAGVIKACVRAWVIKACVRAWVIKECVRAWVIKACVRAGVIKACVRAWVIRECVRAWVIKACARAWVIKECVRAWVIKACVRAWVIKECVRAWVIKACVRAWVIKACVRAWVIKECVRAWVIKACVRAWVIKACVRAWVIKACVRAWVIKACVRAWVIKACVRAWGSTATCDSRCCWASRCVYAVGNQVCYSELLDA